MRLYFINDSVAQKEVILFVHIDKTAGQTLKGIIDKQYQISEVRKLKPPLTIESIMNEIPKDKASKIGCYFNHLEDYLKRVPGGDEAFSCIYGHIYFGAHSCLSKPFTYITMLRDPVDRVISHYYYLLAKNHFKTFTSFEDFIQMDLNRNVQTQYISGNTLPDLPKAIEHLERYFSVVGITERFNESLYLMKKQFGWHQVDYSNRNVTSHRPAKEQLSPEIINFIQKNNDLDMELYKYAVQLLDKKIEKLDFQSKQELQIFIQKGRGEKKG
ncbi:sulfotransferase family 2 domain-containing protein [Bacillus salipaludis]|uniref:Sulfotransferase family 2 domain-containing protein n=1 Tax=Bacillus salipaludis TaxID=2547811 RepID=A0ABW8RMK5_9BACI